MRNFSDITILIILFAVILVSWHYVIWVRDIGRANEELKTRNWGLELQLRDKVK